MLIREQELSFLKLIAVLLIASTEDKVAGLASKNEVSILSTAIFIQQQISSWVLKPMGNVAAEAEVLPTESRNHRINSTGKDL